MMRRAGTWASLARRPSPLPASSVRPFPYCPLTKTARPIHHSHTRLPSRAVRTSLFTQQQQQRLYLSPCSPRVELPLFRPYSSSSLASLSQKNHGGSKKTDDTGNESSASRNDRPQDERGSKAYRLKATATVIAAAGLAYRLFEEIEARYSSTEGINLSAEDSGRKVQSVGVLVSAEQAPNDSHRAMVLEPPPRIDGLPNYTRAEVARHCGGTDHDTVWVTFGHGVYNITEFVAKHPGGKKILMAAGGSLEPFWAMYAAHRTSEVMKILDTYRVGNITPADMAEKVVQCHTSADNPYATDPARHPALTPSSVTPFNAEPPLALLADAYITPNELFFVRNHLPVPQVDDDEYLLEVVQRVKESLGNEDGDETDETTVTTTFSLNDLKTKFKKRTVTATIQCAGNRREEMSNEREVKGLTWGSAAISNAQWGGVLLRDVLASAGVDEDRVESMQWRHIQFEGLDEGVGGDPYGASIPINKGMDARGDVLLAFEMNGEPIPSDHGYPIRAIVPGHVGARNVKWVSRVVLSREESRSHWQRNDYKGFSPSVSWDNVDFKSAPSIQEYPVQSAICEPVSGTAVPKDMASFPVRGYAWSGGGRAIVRVDVSADGGKTWQATTLDRDSTLQAPGQAWAWTPWQSEVQVPKEIVGGEIELICKAVDSSYNVQPDTVAPIWNLRGVLNNSWHRVLVRVEEDE